MKISLQVADTSPIRLTVPQDNCIGLKVSGEFIGGGSPVPEYKGDYEVSPSESEFVLETNGKRMNDDITIHAVSNTYIGSAIDRNDADDLVVSGSTITAPSGYYQESASKSVAIGSATTPTGSFEANPTISIDNDGLITASYSKSESITPIVVEGYVSSGNAGTITFAGTAKNQMTKRTSSDLTISDDTITAPAGYYPSSASKSVSTGSATTPATSITANPSISVDSDGLISASVSVSQSVTPSVSAGYVSSGTAGTVSVSGSNTNQLDTQGSTTITPTTSEQTAVSAGKYTTGEVKVSAMPNGVRGNRVTTAGYASGNKKTFTISYPDATNGYYPASTVSTPGTIEMTRQTETVTPTESSQDVTPTNSFYYLEKVTVNPISSTYVGSGIAQRTSSDMTVSGDTVTAPAGYYASSASNAVASGVVALPAALASSGGATVTSNGTEITLNKNMSIVASVTTPGYVSSIPSSTASVTLRATDANFLAENIKSGVSLFGKTGSYTGGGGDDGSFKAVIERTTTQTQVTLPNNLTKIGDYAFHMCTGAVITSLPSGITSIGTYAFTSCVNLSITSLPSGITGGIGDYTFQDCTNLALTSLPSGITSIGASAFQRCTNLALTSLPSGITSIGLYAFQDCTNIALTVLPSGTTNIGNSAFRSCSGLINISCEGAITTLGSLAFAGTISNPSNLESVSFPNMIISSLLASFGSTTAANSSKKLHTADIGSTQAIAANAFANCYALQTLVLRRTGSICSLANVSAFLHTPMRGYNSLTGTVYVPEDLISTYQTATNWSTLYNGGTLTFQKIEGSAYEI